MGWNRVGCKLHLGSKALRGLAAIAPLALAIVTAANGAAANAQAASGAAAAPAATAVQSPAAGAPASATDLAGIWQGTLMPPNAPKGVRLVIKVTKGSDGSLKGALYNADQGSPPLSFATVTLQGTDVKFANANLTIEGKLSGDGKTIEGIFGGGGPTPIPISMARTNPDDAWPIPEAPKPMAEDADPSFDVATIKPNNSGATQMQGLVIRGRNFITRASSLEDLLSFAFSVQAKQIVGGPAWMNSDRYDIEALPDAPGVPNTKQIQVMMRKMLADRFKLTFHHEQREMSAYVLEVGKNGEKLTPNDSKGNLPGLGFGAGQGGITLRAGNATMDDLAGFLQILVLDRPVVNRTGLTGKYDLKCTFTPDDSQFNGHPPRLPAAGGADSAQSPTADVASAPSLYEAFEQQLGLKLTAEKTAVDVIVIDHVEKPSPN
jgi:uncharacterized protein (TIGR03435 family)